MVFNDRFDAGRQLAKKLLSFKNTHPIILALPRGGVPVAFEVSKKLNTALDILAVKKISAPTNKEFAIGAIAPGACIIDHETVAALHISQEYIDKAVKTEAQEMIRQQKLFRQNKLPVEVVGKTVILVDDGLATGITAQAAVMAVKKQHSAKVIFASPVCAKESGKLLSQSADEVICLENPEDFLSVGYWYRNFPQVSDATVLELLKKEDESLPHTYSSYSR